ncbi:MAG: hypothetical protein P1U36_03445 [Legionellaceae bacterium]|nr:hypothetical protein [Legionellaceae bacterium]
MTALVFLNMAKDAVDTFKPYKTAQHRARDLDQFYSGLKNTLKAIVFIPVSILWFIAGLSCFIIAPILGAINYQRRTPDSASASATLWNEISNAYSNSSQMMSASIETLVGSLTQTLRGITQMMTAPFTLLRIPLRDYLSQELPEQKFQDRKSIQRLLAEADKIMTTAQDNPEATANMHPILNELYRKSHNQQHQKQATYKDKTIRVSACRPPVNQSFLIASHFFKHARTTGPIPSDEIATIQTRLDEFRIP